MNDKSITSLQQNNGKSDQTQSNQYNTHSQGFGQIIDQNKLLDYFKSLKVTSISQRKSDFYAYERFINVTQQIFNGDTQISPNSTNIDPLLVRQKISQQQEKTNQLKVKKMEIMQQLALLDEQVSKSKRQKSKSKDKINFSMDVSRVSSKDNNEEENDRSGNTKKLVFSKQEHKQLIMKITKQRQQRQRNRQLMKQKEQEKLKKIQEEQKQLQLKKIQEEKRKKAQQIQEKLKKKREMHQKFLQSEKESQKKVQQIKHRKFLYEEIEEKFEMNVKMPLLQQQKKLLKQKRQFAKAYSIDQIKSHERAYLELRENSMKKSQAKQLVKPPSLENYRAPSKSTRLQKILQEEKLQQRKKLMQKKRAIEQKLQRQQNYVEYLKQNFSKIKIDKSKQEEIKSRIQKMNFKKQQIDQRAIGINYLQQAKKRRRKTAQQGNETQKQDTVGQNHGNITVLSEQTKKQTQSRIADDIRRNNLMKRRQQKIQTLIKDSTLNETQRIRKLKMETQRINEAFKMKEEMLKYGYSEKVQQEAVELLLTSIQAKMGIIDISKEKQTVAG